MHERRIGDEKTLGLRGTIKRFFEHPTVLGMLGSLSMGLILAFVVWISGILSSLPANYVQKSDMVKLCDKQAADIKYLDDKKLDTNTYLREHASLRDEMKDHFMNLQKADERIENKLDKIWFSQQKQYKKQDTRF